MKFRRVCAAVFGIALIFTPASDRLEAQGAVGFQAYMAQLSAQARLEGVSERTINAVVPSLVFNQRVVDIDRVQPGARPNAPTPKYAPYRASHVDSQRIARGRVKYTALRGFLGKVERDTGVPESIMISIWGNETNYGAVRGNYDLAEALASLAYDGRRRDLFAGEFVATLKLIDKGFPRSQLKGSWAGATGHPQFLPSMYLRLGRDGDGDGRADIWNSEADALASIANYFVNAGWRANVPWAVSASIPGTFDPASMKPRLVSPRCPKVFERHTQWRTISEWRSMGVVATGRKRLRDSEMTTLFQPDGAGTPAWLLTGNYRVILDYNCSNFYALSVGLLSDAVE
jgi:membrane-bound lytic murein transglycosylase B